MLFVKLMKKNVTICTKNIFMILECSDLLFNMNIPKLFVSFLRVQKQPNSIFDKTLSD